MFALPFIYGTPDILKRILPTNLSMNYVQQKGFHHWLGLKCKFSALEPLLSAPQTFCYFTDLQIHTLFDPEINSASVLTACFN
ncbi:MAG: hypothetical protein ACO1N4_00580, partial [Pedobacter sp.]